MRGRSEERSIHRKIRAQYGRQATFYSISRSHASGNSLQMLLDWARPQGTERVLDVATGTGFCALTFAPHVGEVVAYDLTPAMLDEAAKLAAQRGVSNMRLQQGPAEKMPFMDESFDIVTCRVAPHHFASVTKFMAESRRVLKPGGLLLIADTAAPELAESDSWQNRAELLRDPSHVRDYTATEWQNFAGAAAFRDIEIRLSCWTSLTFVDWVMRSGSSPEVIAELRQLFATATPQVAASFRITALEDGDFAWEWPVVCLRAIR